MSGIFFSLKRKQEIVFTFALLFLNLHLPAPEGIAEGRKLRLARSGNVNAVIVLKENILKWYLSRNTMFTLCEQDSLKREKQSFVLSELSESNVTVRLQCLTRSPYSGNSPSEPFKSTRTRRGRYVTSCVFGVKPSRNKTSWLISR